MHTREIREALFAALLRVKPGLTRKEYEHELSWACVEVRFDTKGFIIWRTFELGEQLTIALAEAQNWRCCYCGADMVLHVTCPEALTLEHVIPKSLEGPDHPDNMVAACWDCNTRRNNHMSF